MDARAASRASALTNHVVPPLEVRIISASAPRRTEIDNTRASRQRGRTASGEPRQSICLYRASHILIASAQPSPAAGVTPTLASKDTIKVLVTGAAGQIAYSLIFMVARGDMFGPNKKVRLRIRKRGSHATECR